jgi:hypothetical protein
MRKQQSPPAAAYGPFNAVFLAGGSGLNKTLSPSTSLDGVWAVAMDGQGSGQPAIQDPVLAGRASWTLAFWFELPTAADLLVKGENPWKIARRLETGGRAQQ